MKKRTHSSITRAKIAASNSGKIFSPERCAAIRKGKYDATRLSESDEQEFKRLITLGYVPVEEIMRVMSMKRKRYERFMNEFALEEPIRFLPTNISEHEGRFILEAARARVHFAKIVAFTGRNVKQVRSIIAKYEKRYDFIYQYDRKSCQGETKPEAFVRDVLQRFGYAFKSQFGIGQLLYDFHITGTSLLIEVQGDYWHANPKFYPDGPVYQSQKSNVKRDNFKRKKARENGYWVWYVWEHDIVSEPCRVESEIITRVSRAIDQHRIVL
jgi:G:T-mismatch repair DNA endonuclease (very short patch repair protein)